MSACDIGAMQWLYSRIEKRPGEVTHTANRYDGVMKKTTTKLHHAGASGNWVRIDQLLAENLALFDACVE